MGFTEKPKCAVPRCPNEAVIGWPDIGFVCGKCCVKLDAKRKEIESRKNKEALSMLLEDIK